MALAVIMCISLLPHMAGAEEPLTKTINANIALNKYVYSSDGNAGPSGKIQTLTDGRKNTDYTFYPGFTHISYNGTLNDYSGVLPSGAVGEKATTGEKTWYMIDLGRKYNITGVKLYAHSTWDEANAIGAISRYMSNVQVQLANKEDFSDAENVINIKTATWDDFPYAVSSFEGKKAYRYVRVKKTDKTEHGYSELEVFADVTLTEVSRHKKVSASAESYASYPAVTVNDGIVASGNGWLVEGGTAPHYLTVDLEEEYPVSWIEMVGRVIDPDNASTRKLWNVYGSTTEPEKDTITDGDSLIPTLTEGFDGNYEILFPHYSKGCYSSPVYSSVIGESYRYLTFYKTDYNVALSEIRAFVTNPEVINSEVKDSAVYLEFSDEMNAVEDYITVYNSTDKKDVESPVIEKLSDGRIKVSAPGVFGKDITVTVEKEAENMQGTSLGVPYYATFKTPSALNISGYSEDGIKFLDDEEVETDLAEAKTAEMLLSISNISDETLPVMLIIGAYDIDGNLLACIADSVEVGETPKELPLSLSLNGLIGVKSVSAFLIDGYGTLSAICPSITKN